MRALSASRDSSKAAARVIAVMFPALAAPAILLLIITGFARDDPDLVRAAVVLAIASVGAGIGVGAFVSMLDMAAKSGMGAVVPWLLVIAGPVMFAMEIVVGYEPSWLRSTALQDAFMASSFSVFVLMATAVIAAALLAADVERRGSQSVALRHRTKLFTDRTFIAVAALVMLAAAIARESGQIAPLGRIELPSLLRREAKRYPDHFATQIRYGEHLLRQECAQAIEPLRRATALRPGDPAAQSELASALMCDSQYGEAVGAYRAAVRLDPKNIRARYGLAHALERLRDTSGAAAEYRGILLEWPNDGDALARQARNHFSRGDRSHALAEMRRALAVDTNSQVQRAAADLFAEAQVFGDALPIYRSLAERDSADFSLWAQYAVTAYRAGALREAARVFDFLADRHPQLMAEMDEWRQMRDAAHRGILPSDFKPMRPPFKRAYDDTVLFHMP